MKLPLLLESFAEYREARLRLLTALGRPQSYRDPIAEFSERLVADSLGGTLASNVVQKGWDLTTPDGQRVQVRYLANSASAGSWINWHTVRITPDMDAYALVIFVELVPEAILVFSGDLSNLGIAMKKRHGEQSVTFQITKTNYHRLVGDPVAARSLGVEVIRLAEVRAP